MNNINDKNNYQIRTVLDFENPVSLSEEQAKELESMESGLPKKSLEEVLKRNPETDKKIEAAFGGEAKKEWIPENKRKTYKELKAEMRERKTPISKKDLEELKDSASGAGKVGVRKAETQISRQAEERNLLKGVKLEDRKDIMNFVSKTLAEQAHKSRENPLAGIKKYTRAKLEKMAQGEMERQKLQKELGRA